MKAPDIENIIIGSILVDTSIQDYCFNNLVPADFYSSENEKVFAGMLNMYNDGKKIDLLTVTTKQKNYPLLAEYVSKVGTTHHIQEHVELVRDYSVRRQLHDNCYRTIQVLQQDQLTGKEIVSTKLIEFEELLAKTKNDFKSWREKVLDSVKDKPLETINTGFVKLDETIRGLGKGDLIIIAAGPGEGKTTLALNIATKVHNKALIYSYEMKESKLILKMLSDELNHEVHELAKSNLISSANLLNKDIEINDRCPGLDVLISDIKSVKSKAIHDDKKLDVVIVDYLQLVSMGGYGKRGQSRNDEVGTVTRKLKQLAMEINVPIIALSQVSRDKQRKTYVLSDLRDSGNIEQDADVVLFVWRPVTHNNIMYEIDGVSEEMEDDDAIFIVAKNRMGNSGQFRMKFNGKFNRFDEFGTVEIEREFTNIFG